MENAPLSVPVAMLLPGGARSTDWCARKQRLSGGGRAENNNKKQVFRQKILLQHVVMTATSMLNIWPVWTKLDPDDFAVQRSALSSAVLAEPLALRRLLHLYAQGVESGRAPLATHQVTPCRGGSMNCFSVTLWLDRNDFKQLTNLPRTNTRNKIWNYIYKRSRWNRINV